MQSASSMIWTRVTVSISYDDNHYITGTGLLHFTLDAHLILLSVKQGGIKHHFLNLCYDLAWDTTLISRTVGEHSTH